MERALPRRFCKQPEHRKNQWLSLKIIGFGLARGAADLFPHLRKPRKAGKIGVGVGVGADPLADPAIDAVDESTEHRAVTAAQGVAECMQLARIDARQGIEQRSGALMQL